jgi:TonB family protein
MASRNKPFESFGPYILFKKLESDALGDLWRAGTVQGGQLGPFVALRRFTGGNRAAIAGNVQLVSDLIPQFAGTSFAREQSVGIIDNTPYLAYAYAGGRSLRHIIDRARGGNGTTPNPLPIDQAIVIAERVALSLATTADLRDGSGSRLSHGALIPQFIWISDDGEIRVAGQQLGAGIMSSLSDPKVAADIGRYFPPESRATASPAKNIDVYSLGAILFLLVTGQEPPDAMTASAFVAAVRAAKTMTGAPVPDDIRIILDKSFNLDPSMRYASIGDMKQAVSALAHGGKYSATTFNLAFYLSTLLKKEMETEAADREKESKVNVAAYAEVPRPVAVAAPLAAAPMDAPMFAEAGDARPSKSKLPLAVAATLIIAGIGFGAWKMIGKKAPEAPATSVSTAQLVPTQPKPQPIVSEPVIAVASPESTAAATATTGSADAEAQKKAFEEAVRRKMNEEMMKLQSDFMNQLKKQQAATAPVVSAPAPAPAQVASSQPQQQAQQQEERPSLSAAQLDAQRREAQAQQSAPAQTAPAVTQQQPQQTQAPAPQVASSAPAQQSPSVVNEGDVVDYAALDSGGRPVRPISVVYPPIARQQKISATVVVTALVDVDGRVSDVRVLRGDERFGINDAARRAMRATRFSPPMKDGKRVRTWIPQTFDFRP